MRILIIDDNPVNNSRYIDAVKSKHTVEVALKMCSAVRMLQTMTFDVIVIDVMMPTQILSTHNEMTAGFDFYESQVRPFNLKSKIVFWSRLTDSCFNKDVYSDETKFSFVHKSENANHLLTEIDRILQK